MLYVNYCSLLLISVSNMKKAEIDMDDLTARFSREGSFVLPEDLARKILEGA